MTAGSGRIIIANDLHRASAPTIAEFILARVAEDEAAARHAEEFIPKGSRRVQWRWLVQYLPEGRPKSMPRNSTYVTGAPDPARVLAECAAKRRIVVEHRPANLEADGTVVDFSSTDEADYCFGCGANFVEEWSTKLEECSTLRALAAVYADHPDYRQEWTL